MGNESEKSPSRDLTQLQQAFIEIQMPRPPYVLENLVVNARFTDEQRYMQCVLELSIAYDNLRLADLHLEQKQLEIDEISTPGRKGEIERQIKNIEMEQTKRVCVGAMREFETLYAIWEKFPIKYTRAEMDAAQELEYKLRLETQANHDLNAMGRISASNQEGLRQIGTVPYPRIELINSVEKRYLSTGKTRLLIAVPSELKAENGLPCIEKLKIPSDMEVKFYNSWGKPLDESLNHIVETALADHADYIITVEPNIFPEDDAILKLLEIIKNNSKSAIGAWYPKNKNFEGMPVVLENGKIHSLNSDNLTHEVYSLPIGCTIYPVEMFKQIIGPWFKFTEELNPDNYFSQIAREHGWKLLVDTSIKCKNINYESK